MKIICNALYYIKYYVYRVIIQKLMNVENMFFVQMHRFGYLYFRKDLKSTKFDFRCLDNQIGYKEWDDIWFLTVRFFKLILNPTIFDATIRLHRTWWTKPKEFISFFFCIRTSFYIIEELQLTYLLTYVTVGQSPDRNNYPKLNRNSIVT